MARPKATAVQPMRKALAFIAGLRGGNLKLFNKYVEIRKAEGADWGTILKELIEHLPDLIAFITAIVSLFNSQQPNEEMMASIAAAHEELELPAPFPPAAAAAA